MRVVILPPRFNEINYTCSVWDDLPSDVRYRESITNIGKSLLFVYMFPIPKRMKYGRYNSISQALD